MFKNILDVLVYVISRIIFVAAMVGIPTLIACVSVSTKERKVNFKKIDMNRVLIYVYSIILTGIVLAIFLMKAGF